eukprot:1300508-Ditylum_brightwellii.AAC.1
MNSSIKKQENQRFAKGKKEYSRCSNIAYHSPTSHEEDDISSSYSSSRSVRAKSSDVDIVTRSSTWKEKKTKKKN